jgi:hypothetical protein
VFAAAPLPPASRPHPAAHAVGSLFAYVHGPGGVTVELIQLAVPEP